MGYSSRAFRSGRFGWAERAKHCNRSQNKIYIGLDFGDKTIGVAASDPAGRVAFGVETIYRAAPEAVKSSLRRLGGLIKQYGCTDIVLGYPKHMNNTPSRRCEETLAFKERLHRNFKRTEIHLWDERLSTAAVEKTRPDGYKHGAVDEMAAVYILQGFLDSRRENTMDDKLEWNDGADSAITLFDDDGNASEFDVLASREHEGCLYILAAEIPADYDNNDDSDEIVEVLHFKSVPALENDEDEMTLDLVDAEHEDFELVQTLFKDDYVKLGIEMESETED